MSLIKKIGIWILALVVFMVGIAYTLFFLNQDVIKNEILLDINRNIQGKLLIEKVSLNLFSNFPQATINIEGVKLFEQKFDSTTKDEAPVLLFEEVRVSLNIIDLFEDKLLIERLMLEGGVLELVNYADSSVNIENALRKVKSDTGVSNNKVSLSLNSLELKKIKINHIDELSNLSLVSTINTLQASIAIYGDSVNGKLTLNYQLDSIIKDGDLLMAEHTFGLTTDFEADVDKLAFSFTDGKVRFDLLDADLTGSYNFADSGYVDINISADHNDLSELASMELFNPEYLPDIKSGKLTLTTSIQGKTIGQSPIINTVASLSELEVHNQFGEVIKDSGFRLNFYSGTGKDKRDGLLYIDNADIKFASGGYLSGDLLIIDFTEPVYKINWQLEENLVDLKNIFSFPGIKEMNGTIRSQGRLRGKVDLLTKQFANPKGMLRVQFDNCSVSLIDNEYYIKDINGQLFMNEGEISIDNLSFDANGNELNINSKIRNFIPYLLGSPTALTTSLSVHTHSLNTSTLFAFDPVLQKKIDYQVDSIDLAAKGFFLSTDIDSYNLIPAGMIDIDNLTAKISGIPLINNFKGSITILQDNLTLNNLTGFVGESPINIKLDIANYDAYFQTDSLISMALNLELESEKLVAKDFFTVNNRFILPENYENEVLTNVAFTTIITSTNYELQKKGLFPEFSFQVTGLKFQTHYSPVKFRDIAIFGLISENNIYINSLFGKFGRSDLFMNAEFNNILATKDTVSRPFRSRIGINSQVMDLDELIMLGANNGNQKEVTAASEKKNPYADDYPITDLSVNIGQLVYYGAVIKNLSGILNLEENNIIKLNNVRLESGDYGSFEFEGIFDASSHDEAILTSSIKVSNVDLSKLDVTYVENGKEVKLGDHLKGVLNGSIDATIPINQGFNFDINRLTGTVNAVVMDGALVNYAPLQEMSKYFKNKDLNNVYFDDLINTIIFDKGKMQLPYMTINTTLGTIFIMGYITTDEKMELDIQVPVKLVAGAVLNSLFAANKGDDEKSDEIMDASKGKYVNVHVYGDSTEYKIKLGKKHSVVNSEGGK